MGAVPLGVVQDDLTVNLVFLYSSDPARSGAAASLHDWVTLRWVAIGFESHKPSNENYGRMYGYQPSEEVCIYAVQCRRGIFKV